MLSRCAFLIVSLALGSVWAAPILTIHDSAGNLATVDVATSEVSLIGSMGVIITDIAFDPNGDLFGLSPTNLYSIDRDTGATTLIAPHGVPGANALVFAEDGTLYAAGSGRSVQGSGLYQINPLTGVSSLLGFVGFVSAGDLAFHSGDLYLASISNALIRIDPATGAGTSVGPFGFSNVFGLATASNGILYGASGNIVFSVDPTTGAGSQVADFSGQGLSQVYGTSFFTEAGASEVPEPSAVVLLSSGVMAIVLMRRRTP